MLIPVCYGVLLVQWDWNVVLMTLYPCRHSFLPDLGATSGQSPFFHPQNFSSLLYFHLNETVVVTGNFCHSQRFQAFTAVCFLFYIPFYFSPGHFPNPR